MRGFMQIDILGWRSDKNFNGDASPVYFSASLPSCVALSNQIQKKRETHRKKAKEATKRRNNRTIGRLELN